MEKYKIAVVGAGLVGEEMIKCLRESRVFKESEIKVLARSSREQVLAGESFQVKETRPEEFEGIDIALFAGTEGEKGAAVTYAQEAIKRGAIVIDNGADFRMDPDVPLVIPEINPEDLEWHKGLIANPNCTTIIMLMALWPIHRVSPIKRIILTTAQASSGVGREGKEELKRQVIEAVAKGLLPDQINQITIQPKVFPRLIAFNRFPEVGRFEEKGYTTEEWKTVKETQKILHDTSIAITPTATRDSVFNAHSLSIYIETEEKVIVSEARDILSQAPGVKVVEPYATPLMASGKKEVFVGRIREDLSIENGLLLWVCGDNIVKGAALNAVQDGEELVGRDLLKRTRELKPEERFKRKN